MLLSIPQLREFLGGGTDVEPLLEGLRDTVVALWESETNGLWSDRVDHEQTIRPRTELQNTISLSLLPIDLDQTFKVEELDDTELVELVAGDDYRLSSSRGLLSRRSRAAWGPEVVVTYSGGYTDATCPADVRRALLVQARFMLIRQASDKVAIKSQAVERSGSTVYEDGVLHPAFIATAARMRRYA